MNLLRQSTSQIIRFGPFLDSTDGFTPETGLTIAQADMQLSKDGAAFAQKNAAGNATHDTDGWYSTTLNTTDTATNGILLIQVNVAGALPVWHEFYVVASASYDALTTDGLNNVAATDIVSAGAITTSSGAVSSVTTVATTTTNTDMRGTDSAATAANLATVDSNVDAILVDTGTTIPSQITALNDVAATDIVSAGAITTLSGAVANVDLVDTCTVNTDMRGTNSALLSADINLTAGAVDNVTLVATTTTNTDMRGTDGANTVVPDAAGVAPTVSEITTDIDANSTQLAAILLDTGTTLPNQITALNDISVTDILTTQMSESYAGDNVAPTLAQALFLIQQTIGDFAIAGTTITTKRIDGSTTAATYTLDDGTNPTSRTRAS